MRMPIYCRSQEALWNDMVLNFDLNGDNPFNNDDCI